MGLPPRRVSQNGGRVRAPALTAELAPVPLARQTQAQKLNRISGKFPLTQGPSGPGWKRRQALLALRAGRVRIRLRSGPRNGGPGVSGPMGTKCPSAASPGDPLVTFPSRAKPCETARRAAAPYNRNPSRKTRRGQLPLTPTYSETPPPSRRRSPIPGPFSAWTPPPLRPPRRWSSWTRRRPPCPPAPR